MTTAIHKSRCQRVFRQALCPLRLTTGAKPISSRGCRRCSVYEVVVISISFEKNHTHKVSAQTSTGQDSRVPLSLHQSVQAESFAVSLISFAPQ